ncbi:hypothetical protein DL96DRAFT_1825617 [Flagelloscypha sp. PMI_526]|nr:hypothetical protein DL96DRAFT_1825617 [Flagelloscypha sp. PMI_526]
MSLKNVVPVSTTTILPFPDLATEICEMIFQCSSEPDNPSRWGLSLVSREVQKWTDPLLFCHITYCNIRSETGDSTDDVEREVENYVEDLERFQDWVFTLSSVRTPRFEKALSFVRTLHIAYTMGHTEIAWHTLLKKFPQLVAASVDEPWDYVDLDECGEKEEHPTLRFAYGAISGLFAYQEDCTILSNVTHLEMGRWSERYGENAFTSWSIFKNLLYISFDIRGFRDVEKVMSCMPSTVLLVLLTFKADEVDDTPPDEQLIEDYSTGRVDPRLLLLWCRLETPPSTYGPWVLTGSADFSAMEELRESWGSKQSTFWERGLRMIDQRRRS